MGNSGSSLENCLSSVCNGRASCVSFPSDPLYQIAWVKPYNLHDAITPAAVIRPQTASDVSGIIKCAVANNVKVQAKSGGHSYANYGLGGENGAVAVDLVNMQGFTMDNATWQATIGAGTLLGDVTTKLHNAGGRAIAHGVCPGVGIGGHATIGGLGPMSRMWGSCLDHVIEVEVVTADGTILRASETQNADLFWALKGAGAGFGIITEFVVRTHPEPGSVVQYTYSFTFGKQSAVAPVFSAWQDLISDPALDRRFGSEFIMEPLGCLITGTFYGTEAEYDASGIPARIPSGGSQGAGLVVNNWLASLAHDAENEALYLSNIPSEFYSKSLAFRTADLISSSSIQKIFDWVDAADKGTIAWFIIFDASGGAVSDVPMNATAFAHRDAIMYYQSYAIGLPLSNTTITFLDDFHQQVLSVAPADTYGTYPGYVDPVLTDGQQEYWLSNLAVLEQIKLKWDPSDTFHNPQSVRPASSSSS